jgi:hypothetical protein
MWAGLDATGIDMQPKQDYNVAWAAFFVAFMVIGSLFITNLFVGVVIEHFNRMRERLGDGLFLTEEQREWQHTYKRMMQFRPTRVPPPPTQPIVRACYDLVLSPQFEPAIMGCIVLNTVVMAMSYWGMSHEYSSVLSVINYVFAAIFTFEAVIKLVGLGVSGYFSSRWNTFDFTVVLLTDVGILLEVTTPVQVGPIATIVRTIRIGRVFRLAKRARTLQRLFDTFILTLPQFANIGLLLLLLLVIYSILGVQLFASLAWGDNITAQANFQTFGGAIMMMMRFATGEAWNSIMHDAAAAPDGCVPDYSEVPWAERIKICGFGDDPEYNPPACEPPNGCGASASYPFFLSFTLLITFIFLNLFIAVILERFDLSSEEEEDDEGDATRLSDAQFEHLKQKWMLFDPNATLEISADALIDLLRILRPPLGFGDDADAPETRLFLRAAHLNVPMRAGKKVHFGDVAEALARRVFRERAKRDGREFEAPENHKLREKWQRTFNTEDGEREPFDVDNYFAAKIIERMLLRALFRRRINESLADVVTKVQQSKRELNVRHSGDYDDSDDGAGAGGAAETTPSRQHPADPHRPPPLVLTPSQVSATAVQVDARSALRGDDRDDKSVTFVRVRDASHPATVQDDAEANA